MFFFTLLCISIFKLLLVMGSYVRDIANAMSNHSLDFQE